PGGRVVNWPLRRRFLSRFANVYIHAITRLDARDCTSGYRCWRRDTIHALPRRGPAIALRAAVERCYCLESFSMPAAVPAKPAGLSVFFPAYNDSGTIASMVIRTVQTASK